MTGTQITKDRMKAAIRTTKTSLIVKTQGACMQPFGEVVSSKPAQQDKPPYVFVSWNAPTNRVFPSNGPDRDGCTGVPVSLGKGVANFYVVCLWDGVIGSVGLRVCVLCGFREWVVTCYREGGRGLREGGVGRVVVKGGFRDSTGRGSTRRGSWSQVRVVQNYGR